MTCTSAIMHIDAQLASLGDCEAFALTYSTPGAFKGERGSSYPIGQSAAALRVAWLNKSRRRGPLRLHIFLSCWFFFFFPFFFFFLFFSLGRFARFVSILWFYHPLAGTSDFPFFFLLVFLRPTTLPRPQPNHDNAAVTVTATAAAIVVLLPRADTESRPPIWL